MQINGLVSIIIPVYNGAQYIEKAIESVLSQEYTKWELIIVNDCSTDNTLSIINNYAKRDSRIKVFSNEKNLKLPSSLNVGFSIAVGEYLTWTSDDNMFRPKAINTMVTFLNSNPDIDLVYSDYTTIDSNDNSIEPLTMEEPSRIVATNPIGACFLYTRRIANVIGEYDTNLFLAEDYDYWIRIFCAGKLFHLKEDLYLYRVHAESLTETKRELIQSQTYKTLEKNFLTMYNYAYDTNQVIPFFDHIIYRIDSAHKCTIKNTLCRISQKYRYYLIIRQIKQIIKRALLSSSDVI